MYSSVLVCVQVCLWRITSGQPNSYRAAVLEYAPHTESESLIDNWDRNLREYLKYIEDASNQRSQVIVFPENGLSGMTVASSNIDGSSTEVPDPGSHILPCTSFRNSNYSLALRELSCAARNHNIYIVVNLIEKATDHATNKKVYYNTNVVFNRNGEVVARHRKINLYKEPHFTSGNEVTSFTTDFGVTFGVFVCNDVLYRKPALEVLEKHNATDIIFSTAWYSELPFSQSLGVQHAYAKSNGVNLLAAGINNPKETNGGSGIYLADGRIGETFISGTKVSKLIIQDVPKISTRLPNGSCKFQKASGSYKWGVDIFASNTSGFYTTNQNLHDYTFKKLNLLGHRKLTETICSSNFCCTFNISISRTNNIPPNYIYKLVAFQGAWPNTKTSTIGQRNCAIVACTSEDNESCGDRNAVAPRGIRFEEVAIAATVDNLDVNYRPYTVTYELKPVTDYTFCVNKIGGDKAEILMTTTDSIDSLLTFGVSGRVFKYDQRPAGLVNQSFRNGTSFYILLLVLLVVGILHK